MKKSTAVIALSLAAAAGMAHAADLPGGPVPYYSSPAPMGVYNWGGFYAGANVGYNWGKITNNSTEPDGIAGGLQAGYNWQSGNFVLGGETDIQATAADDTFASYKFSNPWFGTLRARAGYAWKNILVYGTAGFAYGGVTAEKFGLDESKTETGWTAGLGMEVGFAPNWSAKAEYLYMDLGNRYYTTTAANNGLQTSLIRFGINYHF